MDTENNPPGNSKCGCTGGSRRKKRMSKRMSKRLSKTGGNKYVDSVKSFFSNTRKRISDFFTRNKKHTTIEESPKSTSSKSKSSKKK